MEKLYTAQELVDLGVFSSIGAAANMRYLGTGPRYLKYGDKRCSPVRYRESDVQQWLDSKRVD